MNTPSKTTIKGLILERWLEDLRQDRPPAPLPEMAPLSERDVDELLRLARWYKAALFPARPEAAAVATLHTAVLERVRAERAAAQAGADQATASAGSFGALIRQVRAARGIAAPELDRALVIPAGTVDRLESEELPPHRLPLDKMAPLLRCLGLAMQRVVDLMRVASLTWAQSTYGAPQTRLGLIDGQVDEEERRRLLDDRRPGEQRVRLAEEIKAIERYCRLVARSL